MKTRDTKPTSQHEHRLPRAERLRGRAEVRKAFRTAERSVSVPGAKLLLRRNGLEHNRILLSPRRGFGTAVERNRAKRLFRENYRLRKTEVEKGYDLVFLIYPGPHDAGQRAHQAISLLERSGLLGSS